MYKYITGSKFLLFLLIMTGITSCNAYKKLVEPPQADTEGIIRDSTGRNGDTTTLANISWKDYFRDAKLQALIAEGLNNNYDMKVAISRIQQAEVNLGISRASLLPTLSGAAANDYTRTSSGSNGTKVLGYTSNVNSIGFSASWEIDLWGKLRNQARSKYALYLNTVENRNLVQTNIVSNIAVAYYNLLALDKQLQITTQTVEVLQKSAETMQQLKESGQQNGAAVEQSKALLYSTQLSIPSLETSIRKQEDALSLLLGRKPGSIDRDSIVHETVPTQLDYGLPVQLLAKRPDVRQAELTFCSAYALTNAARASLYPTLTISSANAGFASGNFSDLFKPASIAAEIVSGLTQPIFNKKQLRGNLKIAQAQQQEALLDYQYTILTAGQEVSDILYGYKNSLRKNDFRNNQIQSLLTAVDFTHDLLLAGEANYTEVLTAQQSLLSAQLNQVSDKLEQLTYSVNLYKALGGGTK